MPERGGGEGGGGKHAPSQAVLLRGVVGLLNPAPGTNLKLKGITNLINSSKKVQFHPLMINRHTNLLVAGLSPLPPAFVVDVISRDPELASPPPNHPTHQNLQFRLAV